MPSMVQRERNSMTSEQNDEKIHYIIRPETILMCFVKGFFQQEKLWQGIPNEFRYVDNVTQDSLIVDMSENFGEERINAAPAIIFQEMGATESVEGIGPNTNWSSILPDKYAIQAAFYHPFTVHCIGRTKESAKLLQATLSQAFIVLRKAIYGMGIDHMSPLQMHAPQRLESPNNVKPSIRYDCAMSFQIKAAQQWIVSRVSDGNDVQPEEEIYINIVHGLSELEYDSTCTPLGDPSEWFSQQVTING